MRLLAVVNELRELSATMTTTMLLAEAAARGVDTWVAPVTALSFQEDGHIRAAAVRVTNAPTSADVAGATHASSPQAVDLDTCDLVLVRTNPARDDRAWAHLAMVSLLRLATERGVVVINHPDGLSRGRDKLYLAHVPPALRPRTLVTRDIEEVTRFVTQADGPCILKPLTGTRGTDVFLVEPGDRRNLRQIVEVLGRSGFAMVQDFVPEAVDGDTRVIVMDGELLTVDGATVVVRRIPGPQEFRSNVFQGGRAAPAQVTEGMRKIVAEVGPRLREDGLFLVGLDLIGDKVIELNVHSPGGFWDAEQFYGRSFVGAVMDALLAKART